MSNELKQFYREIWAWIQDGCPEHPVFKTHAALCWSLYKWCDSKSMDFKELDMDQQRLFYLAGLNKNYPFNAGYLYWSDEVNGETLYTNPSRLDFIEEHAK